MKLIGTKQLREILGVSKGTLDAWRNKKVIPYLRIGDVIRYDLERVKAALANYYHDATAILGAEA